MVLSIRALVAFLIVGAAHANHVVCREGKCYKLSKEESERRKNRPKKEKFACHGLKRAMKGGDCAAHVIRNDPTNFKDGKRDEVFFCFH